MPTHALICLSIRAPELADMVRTHMREARLPGGPRLPDRSRRSSEPPGPERAALAGDHMRGPA